MWKPEAYRWKVDATPGMASPKTGPARANLGEAATHRGTPGATGGKRATNPLKATAKNGTVPATRGKASAVLLATRAAHRLGFGRAAVLVLARMRIVWRDVPTLAAALLRA